jgi:hypothetical protein
VASRCPQRPDFAALSSFSISVGSKCQDDWEFAGPDDAKAVIRTARWGIRCEIQPAVPAMISCRRSLRSYARSRAGCRPSSRIPWMMACPAAEARHACDETFRHAGETIFQSHRSPPETNPGYQ